MDFGYLFQILNRRKWVILSVMPAAALLVFYLIGRKPEQYKGSVILSTGIVNYKGINSNGDDAFVQQFQIENAFSNLIEFAQSRSSLKILTLHMLKHDLTAQNSDTDDWPFRNPNMSLYGETTKKESQELLQYLQKIRLDSVSDPTFSQEIDYLIDRVARVYGYDHDAILRCLTVKRRGATDYLLVEVVTENPRLSQYMANTYVNLFMTYYQNLAVREKRKNVQFYTQLAAEKKAVVDTVKTRRYRYLYQKGLPSLGKQSEELVNQIGNLELQKQKADAERLAATEAVGRIQQYIDQRGATDVGETRDNVVQKNNVADLSARVRQLTEQSAKTGGADAKTEAELAGARHALDMALKSNAASLGQSKRGDEARRTKEDLYKEKVQADINRINAEKSIGVIQSEIEQRTAKLSAFVTNDEIASGLADEQVRAEDEFKKVNEQLIEAKLNLANAENPLQVIENAQLPEWPEPNRQVLLSIFAAIVAGTMTIIAIFLLAYFDRSLQNPDMFKQYAKDLPILGFTPFMQLKNVDFKQVFSTNGEMPQFTKLRENLRKIRNKLLQLDGKRVFMFVSTRPQQGKTMTSIALAHALAANHKRVVLVDTNFKTPLPDQLAQTLNQGGIVKQLIEKSGLQDRFVQGRFTEVGKGAVAFILHRDVHLSPSEIFEPDQLQHFLDTLRTYFDYVFLEAAALNQFSDAQEILPFADSVIAVFSAETVLKHDDHESIQFLRDLKERLAGVILTGVDDKSR